MIYIVKNKKMYEIVLGSFLLIIGIIIFNNPFGTLELLAAIVAWLILLWGIINLITYKFMNKLKFNQPWILAQGILNIIFAVVILMTLNLAVITIMTIFGSYVVILSTLKIMQGIKLKKYKIVNWELSIASGIIGIIFGVCLVIFPEIVPIILSLFLITIGSLILVNSLFIK